MHPALWALLAVGAFFAGKAIAETPRPPLNQNGGTPPPAPGLPTPGTGLPVPGMPAPGGYWPTGATPPAGLPVPPAAIPSVPAVPPVASSGDCLALINALPDAPFKPLKDASATVLASGDPSKIAALADQFEAASKMYAEPYGSAFGSIATCLRNGLKSKASTPLSLASKGSAFSATGMPLSYSGVAPKTASQAGAGAIFVPFKP